MKHIQKGQEPTQFIDWKNQEKETLDGLHNAELAGEIWEHLPSSYPHVVDEGIIYYSKFELKGTLLNEQGFICCYCNKRIKNDHNTIIEHLQDKSTHTNLTLDYNNLLASCNGGQKDPKPRDLHCDANKGNKVLELSPLDELCELQLYFSIDGKIYFNCEKGEQAIEVLNLGIEKLNRLRKSAIEGFIYDEFFQVISNEEAKKILDKIYQKDASNQFIEFCSAIKSVIEREILNQKDE